MVTLGHWSGLGYLKAIVAGVYNFVSLRWSNRRGFVASGLYMLTFGVLGLIPAPKVPRK